MVLELIFGFLVLVAASYIGTTMALRGFFGRKRDDADFETNRDGPPGNGGRLRTSDAPRTDDVSRADDVPRADNVPRADDVARANDVSSDDAEENE